MDSNETKQPTIKTTQQEINKAEITGLSAHARCAEPGNCHQVFCDGCPGVGCDLDEHEDSLWYCGICRKKRFCADCRENDSIVPTMCEACYRGFCIECQGRLSEISKCHVCSGYLCGTDDCSKYYLECPKCQLKMCTHCDHLGRNICPKCDVQFKQT